MEYVDGVPLTRYCETHRSSVVERLRLFRAVCEAVEYAHQHGIVHRDLKPSNILVKQDGTVRLLDFGIAKQIVDGGDPRLRHTTVRLMTPAYAAPEQLRGEPSGIHTDVYSLGVILYELLTGRLPFEVGDDPVASSGGVPALLEAMNDPVPPSAMVRRSDDNGRGVATDTVSWSDLDVLCLTAMHVDAERRYQSVAALIRDVDRFLAEQPLHARPDDAMYKIRKFARRNRRALAASMLAVVVAGGLALVAGLAVGLRVFRDGSVAAAAEPRAGTLAVLPFRNVGADTELDFLRLALPDEIATALSRIPDLAVRPTTATSRYVDASLDSRDIGRDLQVETVVTGRFARAGDQLRITLEATDVDSNRILWRDSVDAPAQSLIATHIQIALRVREGLAPVLGGTAATSSIRPPSREDAYNLFLRSTTFPYGTSQNAEGLALLEQSVALDPDYVPAWHALARRYYGESRFGSGDAAMMDKWERAVKRVLALDSDNVPTAAGYIRGRIERGELAGSYRDAQDMVRRHPDSVDAHFTVSYAFRYAGLLQEAARHCERALVLDARTQTSGLRSCAIPFIQLGDYPRALNFLHLDNLSGLTKALTIDLLVRQGREEEALRVGSPGLPMWVSSDLLLACVGRRSATEVRTLAAGVRASEDPEINYLFAGHLSYCGQSDAALAMLRRAVKGGYCSHPAMDMDPFFADLRGTPELAAIRAEAIACREAFLAQLTPSSGQPTATTP